MTDLLVIPSAAGNSSVNVAQTAEEACKYLGQTGTIYRREHKVVHLVGHKLEELNTSTLQTMLFTGMNVQKWAQRGRSAVLVPATDIKEPVLRATLDGHFARLHIPPVTVVAQRPYLVLADGQLVPLKAGYNAVRGGILVTGDGAIPEVPTDEATCAITALFQDFNFATPADKSRAIAAVFSAAMRIAGIYERHPLLAFEADLSQTGKTLLFAMIVAIFGQRCGSVAQKKGGTGSFDEAIMQKLVNGYLFILLDNIRGRIDSPFLEMCLTPEDGEVDARVLRASVPVDPRPVVFGLTSNAAELTKDLANRTLMVRIRKQPLGYQFHTWTDTNGVPVEGIRQHITAHQAYYQGCVSSILRDWWAQGAPRLSCTDHDFKTTVGALDHLVHHYFKLPPILDGHQVALERTTKPGLSWLRQIALQAAREWHVVDWMATKVAERCLQDGIAIPGLSGEAETKTAAQQVGQMMSSAFGTLDQIMVDNITISRSTEFDKEGRPYKVYTFVENA
jgi:hypothetical protein